MRGIRHRITIVSTAVLVVCIALAGAGLVLKVRHDLMASLDESLRSRADVIRSATNLGTSPARALIEKDESFAQVLTADGSVTASTASFVREPLLDEAETAAVTGPRFFERTLTMQDEVFPARMLATRIDEDSVLVVGSSIEDEQEAVQVMTGALVIGSPLLAAIGSFIVWTVTGAALRPVERMREEADALSMSEVGRPLPVPETDDEIARLGHSLNALLARLADAFASERRFLDEASHELRTPVTTLKAELELALNQSVGVDELRTAIARALSDADYLSLLTEDLLVMARADDGRLALRRTEVDLGELASQVASGFRARADAVGCSVSVDVEATAHVDPLRIRQVLNNLIDNALRHGGTGNKIFIRGSSGPGGVELVVEDRGPGFTGDPFSGTEPVAGSGLGMRIVKAIVEAHGGQVEASNREAGGARVQMRFPSL